jgi:glycosyltransferase involved in cell wall biosynthesis
MSEGLTERLDRAHDLIKSGRFAEAVPVLERLAAQYPDNLEAWFTLAQAAGALDRHAEAEAAFSMAAQLRPEMHEAHLNLALSRVYQKKLRDSIPAFVATRRLKPDTPGLEKTLLGVLESILQEEPRGLPERLPLGSLGENPLVSVVIPTRDRTALLKDALESVGRQTYRNWEAVVVNDGGEDISGVIGSLPKDVAGKIAALRLEVPGGAANARNRGIDAARGEVIAFLDDDDLYLPTHLETLVAGLRESGAGVAFTLAAKVEERVVDGKRVEAERGILFPGYRYSRSLLLVRNFIPVDNWGIRKACFEQCGAFDAMLPCLEDWDLLLRLSEKNAFHRIPIVTAEIHSRQSVIDSMSTRIPPGPVCELLYRRYPSHGNEFIDLAREIYLEVQFPFSRTRSAVSAP